MCEHVYKEMEERICPLCGAETHDIDWNKQSRLIREHREKVGLFYQSVTHWAI